MRSIRFASWVLAAAVMGWGCGDSHEGAELDAGAAITFDADVRQIDAGTDAGHAMSDIGQACTAMSDCDSICLSEPQGFMGGYCSAPCGAGVECPLGSVCTPVGDDEALCLQSCEAGTDPRSCRAGYGCATGIGGPPICLPGCTDASDCAEGRACDPTGGFNTSGTCYTEGAAIGDPCLETTACPANNRCLSERNSGWPNGACVGFGCDVASGMGCTGDAQCIPTGRRFGSCVDGCATDEDCREGYRCQEAADLPGRRFCGPGCVDDSVCSDGRVCNRGVGTCEAPFQPADYGRACSNEPSVCEGGLCLAEFATGFPGSYCGYAGCDPTSPTTSCPAGGVCIEGAGGLGLCLDACEVATECTRPGYDCVPIDDTPESPSACQPACTTDDDCVNEGYLCDSATGFCQSP